MSDESAKKFRKRMAAIVAAAGIAVGGTAVTVDKVMDNKKKDDNKVGTTDYIDNKIQAPEVVLERENIKVIIDYNDIENIENSFENHPNYYNEQQMHTVYLDLVNKLEEIKNIENLDKGTIINLCNEFKKINASMDYIGSVSDEENKYEKSYNLQRSLNKYWETCETLIGLVNENNVIITPGNEGFKNTVIERLLIESDYYPIEEMKMAELEGEDEYYYFSQDGKFILKMFVSQNPAEPMNVRAETNISNLNKMVEESIKITEIGKEIPSIGLNELTGEKIEESR